MATATRVPLMAGGKVTRAKDGDGFWLPNEIFDLYGHALGAKAVYLYCWLCRSATRQTYPGLTALAKLLRHKKIFIRRVLTRLYEFGLLNQSDLAAIKAADEAGWQAATTAAAAGKQTGAEDGE